MVNCRPLYLLTRNLTFARSLYDDTLKPIPRTPAAASLPIERHIHPALLRQAVAILFLSQHLARQNGPELHPRFLRAPTHEIPLFLTSTPFPKMMTFV